MIFFLTNWLCYIVVESICTHYSKLSGRPDIFLGSGTLKKSGPKKSRVPKNRVILIQKENRQLGLFSFEITMTLIFCTLLLLDLIFFRVTNRPMFSKQEQWVQIDWATLQCMIILSNFQSTVILSYCAIYPFYGQDPVLLVGNFWRSSQP